MTITNLDHRLEALYDEWTELEGIGPCGHYAEYRRQHDGLPAAACTVVLNDGQSFGHYVNIMDGEIYDMSNPFADETIRYEDIEILSPGELPECVDTHSMISFSRLFETIS